METLLAALVAVVLAAFSEISSACSLLHFNALVCPTLCGLIVGAFAWMIVYIDSETPGVNPPVPFFAEHRIRFVVYHKTI